MAWEHDKLAEDLAAHVTGPKRMVWLNIQLGPAASPRPDVYSIDKSFVRPNPTAYEVKISREDFRSDVTSGKWSTYREYAHRIVFAAPAGLLSKSDVPEMCGLILRHENAWRLAKAATVNPRPIAQEALLKLLIDGVEREGPVQRKKHYQDLDYQREFNRKFGATAARYVCDATGVQQDLANAQRRQQEILERADRDSAALRKRAMDSMPCEWKALLHVLELPDASDEWAVRRAIADLNRTKGGGEEGAALSRVLTALWRIVQNHEHLVLDPQKGKGPVDDGEENSHV